MASWQYQDQRIHPVSRRFCSLLVLLMVGLAVAPEGIAQANSGTTCFKGMHYATGAAGCDPHSTGLIPAPGGLPGSPSGPTSWFTCLSSDTFWTLIQEFGWPVSQSQVFFSGSTGFWQVFLIDDGFSDPQLGLFAPIPGPCPPAQPPPPPGNPIIFSTFASILAFAPEAFWSGTADCPPGEPSSDACPPSVGSAIHIWVANFASARGPSQVCSPVLSPFWYFTSYQACLRWRQVGATTWDFDDETINGARIKGLNYGVVETGTGPGSAINHTFEYPSGFDPIRNCVRPCRGDALGPPLPGHPGGSPAFQVTVSSVWEVELQECFASGGPRVCTPWRFIDLRTLGASTADFTSTSLIPIPVIEYGATPP